MTRCRAQAAGPCGVRAVGARIACHVDRALQPPLACCRSNAAGAARIPPPPSTSGCCGVPHVGCCLRMNPHASAGRQRLQHTRTHGQHCQPRRGRGTILTPIRELRTPGTTKPHPAIAPPSHAPAARTNRGAWCVPHACSTQPRAAGKPCGAPRRSLLAQRRRRHLTRSARHARRMAPLPRPPRSVGALSARAARRPLRAVRAPAQAAR